MVQRADAGRGICQPVRLALRQRDELGYALRPKGGIHHDDHRHRGDLADRREVGGRIELMGLLHPGHDGHVDRRHQQRAAVRLGLGDGERADVAAGAGPVFDDHRLPEPFGHRRGENARQHVGRRAWIGRHDDRHRAVDRLRRGAGRGQRRQQGQRAEQQARPDAIDGSISARARCFHGAFPPGWMSTAAASRRRFRTFDCVFSAGRSIRSPPRRRRAAPR